MAKFKYHNYRMYQELHFNRCKPTDMSGQNIRSSICFTSALNMIRQTYPKRQGLTEVHGIRPRTPKEYLGVVKINS